jgi:tetratricopeptide (TPR) repeat protein|tara:strand:+ start:5494 stop:6360 length:867 start_codon:yes stop_codon:yes gene_type:complete
MHITPQFLVLILGLHVALTVGYAGDTLASAEPQTFYEQRLLDAVKEMNTLDQFATEKEREYGEIQRRFRGVANLFNGIIVASPDAIEARLIYGKMLDRYGDRDGARDQFIEVLKRDQSIAVAHQQLGTYSAENNDITRALAYYLSAIEYAPNEAVYHFVLGDLLYTFAGQMIESELLDAGVLQSKMFEAFGKAAELASENPVYQFRYGEAFYLFADPDWEAALSHWRTFVRGSDLSAPQAQMITLHIARCLGEMGQYEEARERIAEVNSAELEDLRSALADAIEEAQM